MTESVFSPSWYRVAGLRPRLRGHARIARHEYRGEIWYVLQDPASGRNYRFTPEAYQVIGRMDGRRTVQELWEDAAGRFGDDAPTQQEMIQLLSSLHLADMMLCDVPPDTAELLERSKKVERARWLQNLRSPMALRFPLVDPEKFLARTLRFVRPILSVYGAVAWVAVVVSAAVLVGMHWSELTTNVVDRVLSAQNLLVLWLVYPVVKALHELGHGYMVKAWDGEVHEMGIMLLVLMPIPYVDASAASEFRARHRRVLVGAAGVMVELFLASLAVFLWVNVEPGALRTVAYNVILIGSVSTILFNANPLLRYDGYYVLADLIEIPNLAQRGLNYVTYLVRRYALGMKREQVPHTAPGERAWFVGYSLAAFFYRLLIYTAIILFIAGKFFFIGVLLALWAAFTMFVLPVYRGLTYVASSPAVRETRPRAVMITLAAAVALGLLLFVVPFPSLTRAEGVVWVPEEGLVRAGTDGFVEKVVAQPGSLVRRGQLLIACRHPLLRAQARVLRARLDELQSRYDAALAFDLVKARMVREELASARSELERAEERLAELDIRSPADGRFIVPRPLDLPDRYLRQGDLVAYILEAGRPVIRAVVPQSRIDLVRQRTRAVEVRPVESVPRVIPAAIRREVPGAVQRLPSPVLARAGGGAIATDPTDSGGTKTFEKLFQFDLEPGEWTGQAFIGARVYVRFDHGYEAAARQIYRSVRQLFLRRFNV